MGKNWGYCSPSCEKILSADGEAKKKTLKETQLTIFDPKTCEALQGKDDDGKINNVYNGKQDYCAGLKLPFPTSCFFDISCDATVPLVQTCVCLYMFQYFNNHASIFVYINVNSINIYIVFK